MKKITQLFFLIAAVVITINACRKDDSGNSDSTNNSNPAQVNATISGIIIDAGNQPVIGAVITTGSITVSTDHYGMFLIKGNVTKDRCILQITKAGYLNRSHAFIPNANTVNYIRVALSLEPVAHSINSSSGGTVTMVNGGSIQFTPNSFIIAGGTTPYTGTVLVVAKHYGVNDANFGLMIPGGDLSGKNIAGEDVSLYTYGMTSATLKGSSGESLQLATGTTATITFPIATVQMGSAPATIPLWYLDEATALWKEEGTATKVGNNYVGTVAHFSTWNCDYGGPRANVNGMVIDCEGVPMANVIVTINGGVTVATDANGFYSLWVPSGWPLTFQVLPQGVFVLPSQQENVAPLTTGQTFTVPDLIVPCGSNSKVNGHLTGCSEEAISGTVILLSNNQVVNFQFTATGSFRLLSLENTDYTLSGISFSGVNSIAVTSPSAHDSVDVGALNLCNNNTNSVTSFVITGNGYNSDFIAFTIADINEGYWYTSFNYTQLYFSGFTSMGACSLSCNFSGHQTTMLDFNSDPDSSGLNFFINGCQYFSSSQSPNPFIMEVTHYGAVGDSIKGTFHGSLVYGIAGSEVMISDGKFAFPRKPDH